MPTPADRTACARGRGMSPAIERSVAYAAEVGTGPPYGRSLSPTTAHLEAELAELEGAPTLALASGMAALTCLFLTVLERDQTLVLPDSGYYEVELFARAVLEPFGVRVARYAPADPASFAEAVRGARLALVETPANPLLTVVDVARATQVAHDAGALLCCDNTFATALLQRPLELGADVVMQSATKYLGGHHDVLAGTLATRDHALHGALEDTRRMTGSILQPDAAWLVARGLATLAVRVERQCATAAELARRLVGHPAVTAVRYPGLPDHPGHDIASRQMPSGTGGLLAFDLPSAASADAFLARLTRIAHTTSLGGVHTTCERRSVVEPPGRVPDGLVRLAVGLEPVEVLWSDLAAALTV